MSKHYELRLPVFKQGDDLAHCIDTTKTLADALVAQAANYEIAAAMCRRLASVAAEDGVSSIFADTHVIYVEGVEERLRSLVLENVLTVDEDAEDEDECADDEDRDEDSM
jgi:hypothetical protein